MVDARSPLHPLLDEINRASSGGFPFLAVAMCVALPDICASLASPDGRTSPPQYKKWCSDNLGREFSFVTPDDLYSMRCGVLHNGRFGDMKNSVARVIFVLPNRSQSTHTNIQLGDAYFYGVVEFFRNFTKAVTHWYEKNKTDANVIDNLPRLIQYHDEGVPPYVVGPKVLA